MTAGAPELVSAYISAIGSAEPNYSNFLGEIGTTHPFYPSIAIGHGCLILSESPDSAKAGRRATGYFERANDLLETQLHASESPLEEGPLSALQHTARVLLSRDDPDALASLQGDLHRRTVDTTAWLLWELGETKVYDARCDLFGSLAQQLTVGSYSRRGNPAVLPFTALTHHDQGRARPQNYDALVVYKTTDMVRPRTRKYQVKAGCLALSPDHKRRDIGEHNKGLKLHTAEDIILISGCCDLGGAEKTAKALVAEDNGELMGKERRGLNATSDHMMRVAKGTDGWDRRGTVETQQVPLTSKYLRIMRTLAYGSIRQTGLAATL